MTGLDLRDSPWPGGWPGSLGTIRSQGGQRESHIIVWLLTHTCAKPFEMAKTRFEWDPKQDRENQEKHGVSFAEAQFAFADPHRVIAEDRAHSSTEDRHDCIGRFGEEILAVRFTYREDVIRIFGAGYWRKGKQIYERENKVHRRTPRKPQGRH